MNGCSARGAIDLPQVTSYDYDAPLDEQGNPTEKYFALKRMMAENFPEMQQNGTMDKRNNRQKRNQLERKVSFFATPDTISKADPLDLSSNNGRIGSEYWVPIVSNNDQKRCGQ